MTKAQIRPSILSYSNICFETIVRLINQSQGEYKQMKPEIAE